MFFAGIWREWEGDRGTKTNPSNGKHLVFSFLTTDASPDVAPVHADATPVLLLDEESREKWMNAPWEIARELQKPPPAGALEGSKARCEGRRHHINDGAMTVGLVTEPMTFTNDCAAANRLNRAKRFRRHK
jgi:putative SOS response-associated peptidase YedK